MKLPEDIQAILVRRYRNKHRDWLGSLDENQWPLELSLGMPTEQEALCQPDAVRRWVSLWRSWQGAGTLIWSKRYWKHLGTQNLPDKLSFATPEEVAKEVRELAAWQQAQVRYQKLVTRWPVLRSNLQRHFDILAQYSEIDFQRLFKILEWFHSHPNSKLYSRQLPIAGVYSKWIETRSKLLSDLVFIIKEGAVEGGNNKDFFTVCGLKSLPYLIRLRMLDNALRRCVGGLSDITIPLEELAAFTFSPAFVFIVENLQTGLAFTDLPHSVVLMGLGYGVETLAELPWLFKAQCFYWGDLDTHGFAILNRARTHLPHLQSILMDENTLLVHRDLWVQEKTQHASIKLLQLSETEQALYQGLKEHRWGQNVRLEQERVDWGYAMQVLKLKLSS